MALVPSQISPNIKDDEKLWRYMSLEKLIDLLTNQKLYFTPLNSYLSSDPYEGFLPKIALKPIIALGDKYLKEEENRIKTIKEDIKKISVEEADKCDELLQLIKEQCVKNKQSQIEKVYSKLIRSTVINCWHQNNSESEAMWRLYSDNNKGIAIQTTVSNLIESIDDKRVYFSEVKYIDFYDQNLKKEDIEFFSGSVSSPLLKREAFKHEHEYRLFFIPEIKNINDENCLPELVNIDINKLISNIYISPYSSKLYADSVKKILDKFGIKEDQIHCSDLLTSDVSLTKIF